MSLATIKPGEDRWERIAQSLPENMDDLIPNLDITQYDYVLFDMAEVTPSSVTPRMAGHLDLVLMVVECEKTRQASARQAASLLRESRAHFVTVLNKWRNYVPSALYNE